LKSNSQATNHLISASFPFNQTAHAANDKRFSNLSGRLVLQNKLKRKILRRTAFSEFLLARKVLRAITKANPTNYSMLKFVYCVRKRPKMSTEAFRKYWLENHGPLVREYAKTLRAKRYVQSHTIDTPLNAAAQQPRNTKPAYDGITEIWWDSAEDLIAALSTAEGQEVNRILAEDEARFCDLPNCSVFFTEEHTIF
jgi:uncharacterized protein (TIGR02118 family)